MAKPCPAAPALPLEFLWESLHQNCRGDRTLRALQQDPEFPKARFRAYQIFDIANRAPRQCEIDISINSLARAFNCSDYAVRSALKNGFDHPISRGRHLALDAISDASISEWIKKNAESNTAVTRTDIKNYCFKVYKFQASRGWVDSFILHHSDEFTEKKNSPQEDRRLQVRRIFLNETICYMNEAVQGGPADLGFNLDEVGISDWEDRKPKKVVVPMTATSHSIHHRVSRNLKQISIVTCICASGVCLTPYMMTSQDSLAVRRSLEADGMPIWRHLLLQHRDKPYVNADLFQN
jgi:hypothetical protein